MNTTTDLQADAVAVATLIESGTFDVDQLDKLASDAGATPADLGIAPDAVGWAVAWINADDSTVVVWAGNDEDPGMDATRSAPVAILG